jgi:hypothetical protein
MEREDEKMPEQEKKYALEADEYHPAAVSAFKHILSLGEPALREWLDIFATGAIEGNRLAAICHETLTRILEHKPISDRYLLGLAWTIHYGVADTGRRECHGNGQEGGKNAPRMQNDG